MPGKKTAKPKATKLEKRATPKVTGPVDKGPKSPKDVFQR